MEIEISEDEQRVRDEYNSTSWGKLLIELGFDPYETESCARIVAEGAAKIIDDLKRQIKSAN